MIYRICFIVYPSIYATMMFIIKYNLLHAYIGPSAAA